MMPARLPIRVAAVAAVTVVAAFAVGAPAAALVDRSAPLEIRAVDARGDALLIDVFRRGGEAVGEVSVSVDGKVVEASVTPLAEAGPAPVGVVVLDNSAAVSNGTVQLAKDAVSRLEPSPTGLAEVGVVTTGGGARVTARPSDSGGVVAGSLEGVAPAGGSRLFDALVRAADLVGGTGDTQRNVVAVVGSPDAGGGATLNDAVAALRSAGASLHLISVAGSTSPVETMRELAGRTGGSLIGAGDDELGEAIDVVGARIAGQLRLEVADAPVVATEVGSLAVGIGGETVRASYRPGALTVGAAALTFVPPATTDGGVFASPVVKWLTIVMGSLAVVGVVVTVAQLALRRNDGLDFALRHYDEAYGVVGSGDADSSGRPAILERAVQLTGDLAERRGFLQRIERLLERADLPLRPAEALFFYASVAAISVIVAFVVTGNALMSLIVAILALILPSFVVDFLAKRRKKRFVAVLPDMLQLLAGTLRAGYSIGQGFEAVSTEVEEPMGKELRRAVTEARLGRPLDEALEGVAERMGSEDFSWAVMAIRIQREVGGNLAELLMTVADTMTQRERLRRDVAALTAEGKMSAMVLGLLPPGLFGAMWTMNPDYIAKLFSGTGLILLVLAGVSMLVGFAWMKKTITIEV